MGFAAAALRCAKRRNFAADENAMANNIDGPLKYERIGRTGPVMAFVHPNPMDQSYWIFQMAQMSS